MGVVLTRIQVAVLAGCDPIVLIGADLAHTDGRPYARGTTYELQWASEVAAGATLNRAWQDQIARRRTGLSFPDIQRHAREHHPRVAVVSRLDAARAAKAGRRVVNATGAGILAGAAVEQARLAASSTTPRTNPGSEGT